MTHIDINSIATLKSHGVDYRYINVKISKNEAIYLLRNADLSENIGSL